MQIFSPATPLPVPPPDDGRQRRSEAAPCQDYIAAPGIKELFRYSRLRNVAEDPSASLAGDALDIYRQWRTLQRGKLFERAAGSRQPGAVCLHRLVRLQPRQRLPKNLRGAFILRHHQPVVHPLALAPRRHQPRTAQERQMPGYLRLRLPQHLDEVADANLLLAHQVQQPQPCPVAQRLEEALHVERFRRHGSHYICLDEYVHRVIYSFNEICSRRKTIMTEPKVETQVERTIDAVKA